MTDQRIKDLLRSYILNTELGRAVANRVFTYAPNIDKNEEYIVISVLDGLCGQRQTAIVNVNIYYPDIREVRGDAKVENVSRTRELSDIAESVLNRVVEGDYWFKCVKMPVFKVADSEQHAINCRIEFVKQN